METRPVGAELLRANRRTDRYDESNSRYSQFCEIAPQNRKVTINASLADFSHYSD